MKRRQAIAAIAAFCAIFAFDGFPARAAAAKAVEAGDLDSAGDRPGDWMLEFQTTDKKGLGTVGFVRLLRGRDARGVLKYDEIVMHGDKRYPFGLWDTYLGKCDSHALADIWVGELNADGDARGLPVAKIEYVPQPRHFIGYDTLEKFCNGATMQTVTDPIAYAHDFLKR
jgi:hypothetical protein